MKALSIKQPWASLIIHGGLLDNGQRIFKDIENRSWKTNLRGRIYIHAPKTEDKSCYHWLHGKSLDHELPKMELKLPLIRGAIIGEVDVIDCITQSDSPWFFIGGYGYVLENPVAYRIPFPYPGKLGFFDAYVGFEGLVEALETNAKLPLGNKPSKRRLGM